MRRLLGRIDLSIVYKIILVLTDIVFVNVSSAMALLLRFSLDMEEVPVEYLTSVKELVFINTAMVVLVFAMCRLYTSLWRFASIKELVYVITACGIVVIINMFLFYWTYRPIYRSYFIIFAATLFLLTCFSRFSYRLARLLYRGNLHGQHMRRTMIIGAGEACNVVMKELELSTMLDAKICCIIDDNPRKKGTYIHGVRVVGGRDKIVEYALKYSISEIIVAIPSANKVEHQKIFEICQRTGAELKVLPGVYQLVNGDVSVAKIRNVDIDDLLGREPIRITMEAIGRYVAGKVVLVTGGGGSIGSELCRQLAANGVKQLIILDIYENNAYDIQQELRHTYPYLDLVVLIASVRNGRRLNSIFAKYRPEVVYHAAAHKHVPLMEDSPNEAVKNNVFGTYKTALAADLYGVEKFVLISTDKAVNPTNIMGATKRICEMIIQTFNNKSETDFVAVRFGNVLGSNGSVIPLFKKQIEAGGPVTVTHPEIIRYFMTIPEAVSLVLQAGAKAQGGEIFVLNMGEAVKIADLAKNLIKLSGYTLGVDMDIQYTGLRPGEKLYEELLMHEEGLQETENKKIFIGTAIEFDEEEFLKQLEDIYHVAYEETDQMKEIISAIVSTYQIRTADISRDRAIREGLNKDFADARSGLPRAFLKQK